MPNGILDYENYLNTLQTLTEIGNMFPSEQKTFRYNIEGGGTQGWTATVSYKTLIVDRVKFDRDDRPNFSDSTVIGYYTGTNFNEYSTGTISLPSNMYTGGILPSSLVNIPITVVNVQWNKEGTTYANNIGFIQNWEPGVTPADPTLTEGFVPIFQASSSTLTLTGMPFINYGGTLVLQASTNITDVDLGFTSRVYFYWANTGTNVLLGTAFFNRQTGIATLNVNTLAAGLTGGTYPMFAVFNGIRQYGRVVSNTINQVITPLIPLIVSTQTNSPVKDFYEVGDILTYNLTVVPDPSYPPTGAAVANTATSYASYGGTTELLAPPGWSTQTQFANGNLTVVQRPIDSYFIPFKSWRSVEDFGNYTATITNSVISNNVFTYTQRRRYRWSIKTHVAIDYNTGYWFWDGTVDPPDFSSKSINGPAYIIQNTVTNSITGTNFAMVLSKFSPGGDPYTDQSFSFNILNAPKYHANPITVIATGTVLGVPTTVTLATIVGDDIDVYDVDIPVEQRQYLSNETTTKFFANSLSTGTWTIQAKVLGDLGTNVNPRRNVNTSFSNVFSLTVTPGQILTARPYKVDGPLLVFQRTTSSDILRFLATTSTNLTDSTSSRAVSFYQGVTFLGTASLVNTSTNVNRIFTSSTQVLSTTNQLINQLNQIRPYRKISSETTIPIPNSQARSVPRDYFYYYPNENSLINETVVYGTEVRDYEPLGMKLFLDNFTPPQQLIMGFKNTVTNLPRLMQVKNIGAESYYPYAFLIKEFITTSTSTGAYLYSIDPYFDIPFGTWLADSPSTFNFNQHVRISETTVLAIIGPSEPFLYNKYFWQSRNTNDAAENLRVNSMNVLYDSLIKQREVQILDKNLFTTASDYTLYSATNIRALLTLPLNTITNLESTYATWPGTLDLPAQYGKFAPVTVYAQEIPSLTTLSNVTLIAPDGDLTEPTGASFLNATTKNYQVDKVFSTNYAEITAQANFNPDTYTDLTTATLTQNGTMTFFDPDRNLDYFTTATDSNGVARFVFNANTLTSTSTGGTVKIAARFNSINATSSTSEATSIQAIRSSFGKFVPFQFSAATPSIPKITIKEILKIDAGSKNPTDPVQINIGNIGVLAPFSVYKGWQYRPTSVITYSPLRLIRFYFNFYWQILGTDSLSITTASTTRVFLGSIERSGGNLWSGSYNTQGPWTTFPMSTIANSQISIPVTRTGSGTINNLLWGDTWSNIQLQVDVSANYTDTEFNQYADYVSNIGNPSGLVFDISSGWTFV